MSWRTGSDEDAVWLQYGAFSDGAAEVLLTIARRRHGESVEIQLRLPQLDSTVAAGAEFPRYAEFSFDSGEASTSSVNGIGFIAAAHDGKVYFTTGQGRYDKDLSAFRSVVAMIDDAFGIVVDGEVSNFRIGEVDRKTLAMLFVAGELPGSL